MRLFILLIASAATCSAVGDEGVFIPWDEFKALYRESIEREIRAQAPPSSPEKEPFVYSIDEARYKVEVSGKGARAEVFLSGKVLSGNPEPIPLFGAEAVIAGIDQVSGGSVIAAAKDNRMEFVPAEGEPGFQLIARLLVRPTEDNGAQVVSFGIPPALRNALDVSMHTDYQLVEAPGLVDSDGVHRFSPCSALTVKYAEKKRLEQAVAMETEKIIELDTVSHLAVQRGRIFLTTHFLPVRPAPDVLTLQAPQGAKYIASSLRPASVSRLEDDRYELRVPAGEKQPFSIEFALETEDADGPLALSLPAVAGNSGRQGRFIVEEPEDGQVTVTAEDLVSRIPAERLGEALCAVVKSQYYMSVPPGGTITLTPRRFQQVRTPTTVLDSQQFFSAFEENGNILSTLILDVPPEVGPRLRLKAVPDSEIWSLAVNGASKKVYAGEEDTWMIPLESGEASHVELAFLQQGPKLGLQGRLETVVPETGLPSREIRVGVSLPARVELLSVEGPVNPVMAQDCKSPSKFTGKCYSFSRSFYKGEGMALAVFYKEPVRHARQQKGGVQ